MIGEMVIDSHDLKQSNIRAQMFSVPNSPNKGDVQANTLVSANQTNGSVQSAV
jgi:hypothetical protein